jgi:hypothetical protein
MTFQNTNFEKLRFLGCALAVVPLHYGTTLAVVPAQLEGGTR